MSPRPAKKSVLRWSVGAVSTLAAVGIVAAAVVLPPMPSPAASNSISASPEAQATVVACAGPLLAIGRDASDASKITDAAAESILVSATGGSEDGTETGKLSAPDVSDGAGPVAVSVTPDGSSAARVYASQSASVDADDLSGFAASGCTAPRADTWLVGGSGSTGAADLVLLANPGDVAATVDITVFTADGESTPAVGRGIVIPAGTQLVVPLASLVVDDENPVLRVTSTGAPVVVNLQASLQRTLDPGGVEQVSATATPATLQVIPAVTVSEAAGDGEAAATSVRLLATESETPATVTVTPVDGGESVSEEVDLVPGTPLQFVLPEVDPGQYTVTVSAESPVVAAAWSTTGYAEGDDFAWYAAAPPVSLPTDVGVASGQNTALTLANPSASPVEVTIDRGSDAETVTVDTESSLSVDLGSGGQSVHLESSDVIYANITYRGEGALASYPVPQGAASAEAVVIYPE